MKPSKQQFCFNQHQSAKLANEQPYQVYKQWLKDNGVLTHQNVVYPAYFGEKNDGVIGVGVCSAIGGGKAIIAVPYDIIITVDKVKEDQDLLKIINENPKIFKLSEESAFAILVLYVCREMIIGEKSFYAPYFAIADNISLVNWSHWDMIAVENVEVTKLMKFQAEQIEASFMAFLSIFRRYQNVFPETISNTQFKNIYDKANNFICTRAFGWSLPSISLIPMADSLNHNNDYVTHMLIDTKLEQEPHEMYTVKNQKYNLSILNEVDQTIPKNNPPARKKHRKDQFVEKHKEILEGQVRKDPQAYILWQQYKSGLRNFRQLHYYDESCEEDNDTDEETIENFEYQMEQIRFKEKYETSGITEKNRKKELTDYWKLFVDPSFAEDDSESEDEQQQPEPSKEKIKIDEAKKKFLEESKESEGSSLVDSSSSSDSDDEEFKWMAANPDSHNHKTTYFIMATRKPVETNEQIFNFYGRRSNRFLLVGYNFILDDNKYDSFSFRINIDNWKASNKAFITKIPVPKLINKGGKASTYFTKEIRIKKQRVSMELINHCRALLIGWADEKSELANKRATITIPFNIEFEKKVLNLCLEFIRTLESEFMTSVEEDEELYEKAQKHESKMAIKLRMYYKEILKSQACLIQLCQNCLQNLKGKRLNIKDEMEMRKLGKIREYINSLERGKI